MQTVAAKIAKLPAANWSEIVSGHTAECILHWVVVSSGDASDTPGQVLFFDRKSLIGTPTPDPTDIAAVQYMASGPRAGVLPYGALPRSGSKSRTASSRRSIPFPNP